jgi:hypothetical protein
VSVFAVACADPLPPTAPAPVDAPSARNRIARRTTPARLRFETRDGLLQAELPEFGGYSYDEAGNVHLYLTDTANAIRARALLGPAVAARRRSVHAQSPVGGRILVHRGAYRARDLFEWWDRVSMPLLSLPFVTYTDVDEASNRITVGIAREDWSAARAAVEARIAAYGVPAGAITLVRDGERTVIEQLAACDPSIGGSECVYPEYNGSMPGDANVAYADYGGDPTTDYDVDPRPLPQPGPSLYCSSLRARCRPVLGGQAIGFIFTDGFGRKGQLGCTVGFPVTDAAGRKAYVTAAHCSGRIGMTDGSRYYQSWGVDYADNFIGGELRDPVLGGACDDPDNPDPNVTLPCKWSDALLIAADTKAGWTLGWLYKPLGSGTAGLALGEYRLPNPSQWFQVVGTYVPTGSEWLDKIGPQSGWTYGLTQQTCADFKGTLTRAGLPDQIVVYRCQDRIATRASDGDSGSPVFFWRGSNLIDIAGLVVAKRVDSNGNAAGLVMSSMVNIQSDLGTLRLF